jgi:hypothetical protein
MRAPPAPPDDDGNAVANGARRLRAAQLESEEGEALQVLEVRNAELIESITKQAAEQRITDAAIVALIGAADSFNVSTNPAGEPTAHTITSYPGPGPGRRRRRRLQRCPPQPGRVRPPATPRLDHRPGHHRIAGPACGDRRAQAPGSRRRSAHDRLNAPVHLRRRPDRPEHEHRVRAVRPGPRHLSRPHQPGGALDISPRAQATAGRGESDPVTTWLDTPMGAGAGGVDGRGVR